MPQTRTLNGSQIDALLRKCRVVRVAFTAPGEHYLIPLGYVWVDWALNLMLTRGRKTRMAEAHAEVAFQVDDSGMSPSGAWSSVIGHGIVEPVTDAACQDRIASLLLERFPDLAAWGRQEYEKRTAGNDLVFVRIRPLALSGRSFGIDIVA